MNNNDSELSAENFSIPIDTKNMPDTRYLRSQGKTCNPLKKNSVIHCFDIVCNVKIYL